MMDRRAALLALLAATAPSYAALDGASLERAAESNDLHSLLVWQRGQLLAQHYRRAKDKPSGDWFAREVNFGPEVLHDMRSISKSVVALLVGQAVGRGQIDIDKPVLDFYPELAELRKDGREGVRLSHLLDMASGLAWNETTGSYGSGDNDETRLFSDPAPARWVLDRPLEATPGTRWNYNGGNTTLLAEILEQRSGRPLLDLVRDDLFKPLGITHWEWRRGRHGKPLAYAGLRLTPPDMLKLGRLMLQGGRWEERELVPADWVAGSMTPRVRIGNGPAGYSRQWWCGTVKRGSDELPWTAGVGNGGQRLFIVPAQDLLVVFTAGAYNSTTVGQAEMALFRQIVAAL